MTRAFLLSKRANFRSNTITTITLYTHVVQEYIELSPLLTSVRVGGMKHKHDIIAYAIAARKGGFFVVKQKSHLAGDPVA